MSKVTALATYLKNKYPFLNQEILCNLIKEELESPGESPGGDPEIGYYISEGIYIESVDSWLFGFQTHKYLYSLEENIWISDFSNMKKALLKGGSYIATVSNEEIPSLEGGLGAVYIEAF